MKVVVLYFGGIRELVGVAQEELTLPDAASTVADALESLCQKHAGVRAHLSNLRAAVDEEFVETSAALTDGCTLALIPPVSGG